MAKIVIIIMKSMVTQLVMSVDDIQKWPLEKECLQPLGKGCNRRWWLDMDRQSVPDDCVCNRKRATAYSCETVWRDKRYLLKSAAIWTKRHAALKSNICLT